MVRRRAHERHAAGLVRTRSPDDGDQPDLVSIMHEEVGQLPERYRMAVVLCYLEGLTRDEAARLF